MSPPLVLVPYVSGQLHQDVEDEVRRQAPQAIYCELRAEDDYAYATLLRQAWRAQGDLVVVEQDTVPPPGAIERLLDCHEAWCTHPHRVGSRHQVDTLGLACFRWALRELLQDLADIALAPPDHRWLSRRGHTGVDREANEATMRRYGGKSCVRVGAQLEVAWWDPRRRPSTVCWPQCDNQLARQLRGRGLEPHVHQPPTRHLHLY